MGCFGGRGGKKMKKVKKGTAEINALYKYTLRQLEEVRHEATAD